MITNDYLINTGQNEINDDIKKFCSKIPNINNVEDLKLVDKVFYEYFSRDQSTPKFVRTVKEIFDSKTFSGCSDIGFMMSSILREKGIPTIYVETAHVDWLNKALKNLPGSDMMMGHIFLEVYIHNKWYLYDPTFRVVYDNYDMKNNNYPRGYYVFAKGMNANALGVYSVSDEKKLALTTLKDYDYDSYVDPNYLEIKLK